MSLLMPNSSTINRKVTRRSCASICRTCSIMSGVLLDGQPDRGSSSVVSFPSRKLPSRTLAPTFYASPSPFSLICSRTWVYSLLHCTVTLPLTLTMFNCPQRVYPDGHVYSTLCGASQRIPG
jgi:hypothetical protein